MKRIIAITGVAVTIFLSAQVSGKERGKETQPPQKTTGQTILKVTDFRGELPKIPARSAPTDAIKIYQDRVKRMLTCPPEPSCNGKFFYLSEEPCPGKGELFGSGGTCYVCSLLPELRAAAKCAPGFNYLYDKPDVYPYGVIFDGGPNFSCASECVATCGWTQANPATECIEKCPDPTSLEKPCPAGYVFKSLLTSNSKVEYFCRHKDFPTDNIWTAACTTCGAEGVGANGANGDVICLTSNSTAPSSK